MKRPPNRILLSALAIAVLVIVAYVPAMRNGYVWDDDAYVTQNTLLSAPDGLQKIWFSLDSPSQYFPLVYTTFRIEHAIWGFDPTGYHVVNVILHIINALLIWLVLSRLRIRGAWLAAAIWAVHPVNVESVAWITERKNTLSTVFYLTSLLAWMRFADDGQRHPWRFYALSMVLFQLALFAKTTACTLPAALILTLWLRGQRIDWRRILEVTPYIVLGLAMGALSIWWEQHHQGTKGPEFAFTPIERILIASRSLWFYLGKLVWPVKLVFSYPRWHIDPRDPAQYVWLIVCLLATAFIWWKRKAIGRGPIAALILFAATLAPMLGFISLYTFYFSFVADHYQYVASVGPIALIAALLSQARRAPSLRHIAVLVILTALGILSWSQASLYRDEDTLWRDTIAKNHSAWLAHYNLGLSYAAQGSSRQAVERFTDTIKYNPSYAEGHNNLGLVYQNEGKLDLAIVHYRRALKLKPGLSEAHGNLANALADTGHMESAVREYQTAIRLDPGNPVTHNDFAATLTQLRRFGQAASECETALKLRPDYPEAHFNLAVVFFYEGRYSDAWREMRRAQELGMAPNPAFVQALSEKMQEPQP